MNPLTLSIWRYIEKVMAVGICPSVTEIGAACACSTVTACRRLVELEALGVLRRTQGKYRSIELLRSSATSVCPACGGQMHVYYQPSCFPDRPGFELAECRARRCDLYAVTLTLGSHNRLTYEEIAAYGRAQRRGQSYAS